MFRTMRRAKQQLSDEETIEILKNNTAGTLALLGDDGYPYSLPISYAYVDHKLIFHSALTGHKIDAIQNYEKASFSVIDQDQIIPEKYTTCFRSAIVFGKIQILDNENEIRNTINILAEKYRPGYEYEREKEINVEFPRLCVMIMDIEHMTGKQSKELMNKNM